MPLRKHLSNLIIERPMKNFINEYPFVTVNIIIARKLPFFKEFGNGLISQKYPKNRIILRFCFTNPETMKEVLLAFEEVRKHYHDFDVKCKDATNESSEFTLVLHSRIILRNDHTISKLVSQNVSVIGPMIQTNYIMPKVMQNCNIYQPHSDTYISLITFPPRQKFRNSSRSIKVSHRLISYMNA